MTLRGKLLRLQLLVVVIPSLVLAVISYTLIEQQIFQREVGEFRRYSDWIAEQVQREVSSGYGAEGWVRNWRSRETGLFFGTSDGLVLATSPGTALQQIPETWLKAHINTVDEGVLLQVDIVEQPYQLAMHRIDDDLWFGALLRNSTVIEGVRHWMTVLIAVAALFFAVLSVFFYFYLNRYFLRPLEILTEATHKISAGDYMPEIDINRRDEIGYLADAFRSMGKRLGDNREKVNQLAFYDPLTKLPNRETLRRSLASMIDVAERNKSMLGVLFIDLDDFKKINDRLGHAAGDDLLVEVGRRLSHVLRSSDLVVGCSDDSDRESASLISRRGGDEFNAVLANISSAHDIAHVAQRLIAEINQPMELTGHPVTVSASIGIAIYPVDGQEADELLRNADLAMYEAKGLGKNKYYLFTQSINNQVHERLVTEQKLQNALRLNQFELYYQPRVAIEENRITSFEILIRWLCPERGRLRAGEFIPLAEQSNLILDISNWCLDQLFIQLREWEMVLPDDVKIAVNISAGLLIQEGFASAFLDRIRSADVPTAQLEIEVTEKGIQKDEATVTGHLSRLHESGINVILDDFGSGLSSINYLRKLPLSAVKIDRSYIASLEDSEGTREIVASLLQLCNKLDIETIAEGVETDAQLEFLKNNGCSSYQGFLYAPPLPADQVANCLTPEAPQ